MALTRSYLSEAVEQRVHWPQTETLSTPTFSGNTALLSIAIRNLIENACRYDHTGSPVEVTLGADALAGNLESSSVVSIAVLDRGPGVDDDVAEKIFTQFGRGAQVQHDGLGLGLGLYIVQRIASMHGGTIAHQPRSGGGSVFTIRLGASALN
jgi:signal transduction histidine kinase